MLHKIKIQDMTKEQVQDVFVLSCDCFSTPWSYNSIYTELSNHLAKTLVAINTDDNSVIGFLNVHHILDEGDINNIAVKQEFRHLGIGKMLMLAMIDYAKENNIVQYMLEVRKSNLNAIEFYKKFGFAEVGLRKNYYAKPTEDALLFCLNID